MTINQRIQRMQHLDSNKNICQNLPLLKSFKVNENLFFALQNAVQTFIIDSLESFYQDKKFVFSDCFFDDYFDEIIGLPNITPNGLFLSKNITGNSFNIIHQKLQRLIEDADVEGYFESFHLPISIRLVRDDYNEKTNLRPRSSSKIHTDIWAGEPASTAMLFVPLFGETEKNGISFYEPKDIPELLLTSLNDYNDGNDYFAHLEKYQVGFNPGELFVVDSFLLHRTEKESPKLRISLEFRGIVKSKVESDFKGAKARLSDYYKIQDWNKAGLDLYIRSDEKLEKVKHSEQAQDSYAQKTRLVTLSNSVSSSITEKDVFDMLNLDVESDYKLLNSDDFNVSYSQVVGKELEQAYKEINFEIYEKELRVCDAESQSVWDKGWGEVLSKLEETKAEINISLLTPQYFKHNFLRFNDSYIRTESAFDELKIYSLIRQCIFLKYFDSADRYLEFGCGTGTSAFLLSELFPDKKIVATDWATPSQKIVNKLGASLGREIHGHRFNMFDLSGADELTIDNDTLVYTFHAMEQLGSSHKGFTDYLVEQKPGLCVHIEPIYEFYDSKNYMDYLAMKYHDKRNYLKGWWPYLESLAASNKIEIIEAKRLKFGSFFHEAYSIIVWRPI